MVKKDVVVLTLFYNRFYDLYDEIISDKFFSNDSKQRFYKIKEIFSVYKELLNYDSIKYYISYMKSGGRPQLEGLIADELFSFIRNLLLHYPLFDEWNQVYINKDLATWNKTGTIHKFLAKSTMIKIDGKGTLKYRIWSSKKKKMTYIEVNFPKEYKNNRIYLKNIINEKDGVIFCVALMENILDQQVEGTEEQDIKIMSQVYFSSDNLSKKKN